MPRLQPTTTRLLAVLQEASDLAKTVTLPDGMGVGPILAALVQDLQDPIVRPSHAIDQRPPQEWRAHAGR